VCGIAGLLSRKADNLAAVGRMTDVIAHRGPDDQGVWTDPDAGIALGHRRLSILDLSPLGHQPMASRDDRWMLCFNGEIYNHMALRADLEAQGHVAAWRGHSDTETLVEGIAAWGLSATLERATGMFALALWDRRDRALHLVRDRFGEKPLYYGWAGGVFAFASELGAIRALPGFNNPVDRSALSSLLSRTYIPCPQSIYRGIFKLPPGTVLTVTADALAAHRTVRRRRT
jgi:asparagine synthase (glutamine-hydrolysing)